MKKYALIVAMGWGLLQAAEVAAQVSGVCRFDSRTLAFAGTPQEAAKCLLRPVRIRGEVGPALAQLPAHLGQLIDHPVALPKAKIRAYMKSIHLDEAGFGGSLDDSLSRNSGGIGARFLVIHDTSSPNLESVADFPADIDRSASINRLSGYAGANAVAHLFVNRRGEVLVGHPFSQGWRATRLESQVVGRPARGLFIHVELIQPRRSNPSGPRGNDQIAPNPGFTAAQYERLALAYIVASARAGKWLLPGFHAVIDDGISGGHDDPQNFDLAKFDTTLGTLIATIEQISP